MVPGFNTDFKYRGETYHVQTEDNGTANPVVVTLLYHKGAILASRKTSYRQILGRPGFEEELKTLMKSQHKELMRELLAGAFDRNGRVPSAPGGTGEDPALAAAAVAAVGSTHPQPTPTAAASLAATSSPGPHPPTLPPPVASTATPSTQPRAVPRPAAAPQPSPTMTRIEAKRAQTSPARTPPTAAAPARAAATPPAATLDEQIMRYLREYAAASAR